MKKLILFIAALALMCIMPLPVLATIPVGYVQMSGSYLQDSTGAPVASATICFAPVTNVGAAISYRVNGRGQAIASPVCIAGTNGAFTILLADTALTSPANVCFSVRVVDNVSGKSLLGPGYGCIQPAGSGQMVTAGICTAATGSVGASCNFDLIPPNLAALAVTQSGPAGPAGPPGTGSIPGLNSDSANGISVAGAVTATKLVGSSSLEINPAAPPYNAVCDWHAVNGTISSGSTTFTAISAPFSAGAVGGTIRIPGAGSSGGMFVALITGYTNSSTVTLSASASTAVTNSAAYFSPTNSDDTTALTSALQGAGSLSAKSIPVTSYFMGLVNMAQGSVRFPHGKICRVSNVLAVPPGVTVDLNTASVLQTSTANDAFRVSWDDITDRGNLGFYGVAFDSVKNGSILGPGNSTATNTGLFLYGVAYGNYENLSIEGFKFGLEALESGYNTIKHVFTTYNVVGKYLTARGGANGLPVNITAYAGNTPSAGWVTLTANNGFEQDNVVIAGCNGTNCPTALNGTFATNYNAAMPPACEHGGCTTFVIPASAVTTSGSGLTGVTATPTGSYATLDNTILDDMSDSNSKIGLWCQTCGSMGVHKGDYSYNGEAEIVLGAQPGYADAAHTMYVASITGSFPSGSGCTGSTQPITISGGTQGTGNVSKAQAYAWINGSGQVGAVYVVDGGNGYSVLPTTFSVATCATQPTLTAVGTSEAGLGVFDGTTNVNRGLITFVNARSESVLALNGPNTGYAIQINSVAGNGAMNAIEFDNFCFGRMGGTAPVAYARIARSYGSQISFLDPMCSSSGWDYVANPGNPTNAADVSAFQVPAGGATMNLRLPQGFMANPGLAIVDGNGAIADYQQPTDGFTTGGYHFSNGFQAGGHDGAGVVIQGNVPRLDGANMRVILTLNGMFSIGNGSGAPDIGFCRNSAGVLNISDGATGYQACNANGNLSATSFFMGVGGVRLSPSVGIMQAQSPNTNIYNSAHGGAIFFQDQTSGYASLIAKDLSLGGYNIVIPSTVTSYHGNASGVKAQLSDGTGASVGASYDASGNLTAAKTGTATLSSGTVTVSNAAACTPSATCTYKLMHCGPNASTGIGTLSTGTVNAGTSFVINSLGPTAAVLTTDASTVCWQIN